MNGITSWTSNEMDWSAKDALIPGSLYDRCEAIRLAVRERQLALGQTPSGIFIESFDLHLYPMVTHGIATQYYFASIIQEAITVLIPQFVNHVDHDGNWHGVAKDELAPAWTEAALLTAIDADERVAPIPLKSLSDWIYQQYQILNMLRFIKIKGQFISGQYKSGWGKTYDDALSDFNSNEYTSGGWLWEIFSESFCFDGYGISSSKTPINTYSAWTNPTNIDHYLFSNTGTNTSTIAYYYKDSSGLGFIENKWAKILSGVEESNPPDITGLGTYFKSDVIDMGIQPSPPNNTSYGIWSPQWDNWGDDNIETMFNQSILKPSFAFNNWITE